MEKPLFFLDFDRTLFDTEQFTLWLGDDLDKRIALVEAEEIDPPDFSSMLYADTIDVLTVLSERYILILLTYTTHPKLQNLKINGSGLMNYFDAIIMTSGDEMGSGKGNAIRTYVKAHHATQDGHMFVDDNLPNLHEVKAINPSIRCIHLCRNKETQQTFFSQEFFPDATIANLRELL